PLLPRVLHLPLRPPPSPPLLPYTTLFRSPSVRNVAAEYRINPITVLKGYQQLVEEQLVETKRGLGMFIKPGARNRLLEGERQKRSEEHTSELQSPDHLVCRLLLEKKKHKT